MRRVAEVVIASVAVADDGAGVSGKDPAGVDSFGGAAAGVQGSEELGAGHVHVALPAVSAGRGLVGIQHPHAGHFFATTWYSVTLGGGGGAVFALMGSS